jgi:hypothetical protein
MSLLQHSRREFALAIQPMPEIRHSDTADRQNPCAPFFPMTGILIPLSVESAVGTVH